MKIVIVEDEKTYSDKLAGYLQRYAAEKHVNFQTEIFSDGIHFVDDYKSDADIVFMDIAMPQMNGLEAARRIRKRDPFVCILFITTLAQYAIKGYEVNALDFIVKPLPYDLFCVKLEKAMRSVKDRAVPAVLYATPTRYQKIPLTDILYIESMEHYVYIHTAAEEFRIRASLSDLAAQYRMEENGFAFANRSVLVNLSYVDSFRKSDIVVGKESIPVSRGRKKEFLDKLTAFLCGGGKK